MTKRLEKLLSDYIETEVSQSDNADYQDVVEAGLWSLLSITSEVVDPIVDQVESEYASEKNDIETSYRTAMNQLEEEYQSSVVHIETESKTNLDMLLNNYQTDTKNIKQKLNDQKKNVRSAAQDVLKRARDEHSYAVMISDVAGKETVKKYKIMMHETEKRISSCRQSVDDLEKAAQQVLVNYHVKIEDPGVIEKNIPDNESNYSVAYKYYKENANAFYQELTELFLPKFFLGITYHVVSFVIFLLTGFSLWLAKETLRWEMAQFITVIVVGFVLFVAVFVSLRMFFRRKSKKQLLQTYQHFNEQICLCRKVLDLFLEAEKSEKQQSLKNDQDRFKAQLEEANEQYKKVKAETERKSESLSERSNQDFEKASRDITSAFEDRQKHIENSKEQKLINFKKEFDRSRLKIEEDYQSKNEQMNANYDSIRRTLKDSWKKRLKNIQSLFDQTQELDKTYLKDWQDCDAWKHGNTGLKYQRLIRFGKLKTNFYHVARPVFELMPDEIKAFQECDLPAILSFPNHCSLFIQSSQSGRTNAIGLIKSVMARLFISQPAGRVHFNIFDPIGLGENFVGFMHAVDYEKALVGGRIWTQQEHIQQCLNDLTAHMENVIQKCLRNEYETIEEYNQQAGELP